MFDEDIVNTFTKRWCHKLAMRLGESLNSKGWHLAWTNNGICPSHAFVLSPDQTQVLDVRGLQPFDEFLNLWNTEQFHTTSSLDEAKTQFHNWDYPIEDKDKKILESETETVASQLLFLLEGE